MDFYCVAANFELSIIPVMFGARDHPPCKPEGYDGCTYGKKCEEEINRLLDFLSPNQKHNNYSTA